MLKNYKKCLLPFSSESFVFPLITKNIEIKIYKNRVLPINLYAYDTWSLTQTKRYRLRMFEKRQLEKTIMRSFIICTLHQILLGRTNPGE
jgi:hypothetical protein